jgi:MATE family multidrug resistance protein
MRDVRVPTAISFAGYWLIAAPLAWYFGMEKGWGGPGLWGGVSMGVMTVAVLLVARFACVSRREERMEKLAKLAGEQV